MRYVPISPPFGFQNFGKVNRGKGQGTWWYTRRGTPYAAAFLNRPKCRLRILCGGISTTLISSPMSIDGFRYITPFSMCQQQKLRAKSNLAQRKLNVVTMLAPIGFCRAGLLSSQPRPAGMNQCLTVSLSQVATDFEWVGVLSARSSACSVSTSLTTYKADFKFPAHLILTFILQRRDTHHAASDGHCAGLRACRLPCIDADSTPTGNLPMAEQGYGAPGSCIDTMDWSHS
nr:hypothetical protein CFP56_53706 [Quercus suber]